MRTLLLFFAVLGSAVPASAALDPELRTPYQLRVVVRVADHPSLTKHFRAELRKELQAGLGAALAGVGTVEVIDYNGTPDDRREPLWRLADERGLEALDTAIAVGGGKTHFVFVDYVDGKYEVRARQHDGTSGFVTPIVRKAVHADRGFVGRVAGLAVAEDFGAVGTLEPTDQDQVSIVLKAGDLGPMDPWVKAGDVFAVVQVREARRGSRPAEKPKIPQETKDGKPAKGSPSPKGTKEAPPANGTRLDGVLLQVVEAPRGGSCVCKLYNRYKGSLAKDAITLGYRCVKLGTGEAALRLRLVDGSGAPLKADNLQARVGIADFPDASPRDREEMSSKDGVFTSKDPLKHIAFVLVKAGDTPLARIPVEIYADHVAVRRVNPGKGDDDYLVSLVKDFVDRVISARVVQARSFDDLVVLQRKEKPEALKYGEAAFESQEKDADGLRADLKRMKERFAAEAPAHLFDAPEADLAALESRTKELKLHLSKLRDVIRAESDPAAAAGAKTVQALIYEAELLVGQADYDPAIAKYEEAVKLAEGDQAKANIQTVIDALKKVWTLKDDEHGVARKFVYEEWVKLEKPSDVRDKLDAARRAVDKCKAVGDRVTLLKMFRTGPQVADRFAAALRKLEESATEDEDRQALRGYIKVSEDLQALLADVGKAVGSEAAGGK